MTDNLGHTMSRYSSFYFAIWIGCGLASMGLMGAGCGDEPAVPATEEWVELSAGEHHTCGRQDTGRVECWGDLDFIDIPFNASFTALDAYGDEVCGVTGSGEATCYGTDIDGAAAASAYMQISAGSFYACGLSEPGAIDCWGSDRHGQSRPPTDGPYTAIDTASNHACALNADGVISCWGLGSDPDTDESQQYSPDFDQAVPPQADGYTDVGLSRNVSCATDAAGNVECWGDLSAKASEVPNERFVDLDGSGNNMCGVTVDGAILCWGITDQLIEEVPDGTGFEELSVGSYHGCALRTDTADIVCWGVGDDPDVDETPESALGTEDYDQAVPPGAP